MTDLDLEPVHERLRAILAPYRKRLHVSSDGAHGMILELPGYKGEPWAYVAGTRLGKRYVSYYLMGVYGDPALMDGMSPELRRRSVSVASSAKSEHRPAARSRRSRPRRQTEALAARPTGPWPGRGGP